MTTQNKQTRQTRQSRQSKQPRQSTHIHRDYERDDDDDGDAVVVEYGGYLTRVHADEQGESPQMRTERAWFIARALRPAMDNENDEQGLKRRRAERLVHLSKAWTCAVHLGCTYPEPLMRELRLACQDSSSPSLKRSSRRLQQDQQHRR